MRDYQIEFQNRVRFIKNVLKDSGVKGIVFGNSGGKDSALVGILCKAACNDTVGIIMPCSTKRNYMEDMEDAKNIAKQYAIETRVVDLTAVKETEIESLKESVNLNEAALANMAPRLRMITLYAIAASENRLVAGTGSQTAKRQEVGRGCAYV